MYTSKYRPSNIKNFIGNENAIKNLIKWILEWEPTNKKTKCALISGLNGIGKSLLVELVLKKHDYNMIHIAIDDERDKDYINQKIKPILTAKKTFDGRTNALVVSDIDCSSGHYGFISALLECIKESQIPIICICDDRYCQNIKSILNYCFDIKMSKPTFQQVYPLVYKVVINEQIKISKSKVDKLYEQSNGDIRYILNALQLGLSNKCDIKKNIQSSNIFETTGQLLNMDRSIEDKFNIYWSANDIHTLMIHENYISSTLNVKDEIKKLENIAYSATSISDIDVLDATFNFDLQVYVAYNTVKATIKCNKKGQIKFPQFLGRISTTNKNKREKLDYDKVKFSKL